MQNAEGGMRNVSLLFCILHSAFCITLSFAAEPPFRTDGGDASLPWYQVETGVFPPEGSAHSVSGELIEMDHVNRTGWIRPDRDDTQRRGDWDIARPFTMLPYGTFRYRGAPAELRDIPLGTHLHGLFYADPMPPVDPKASRKAPPPEAKFSRVFLFEDDFSRMQRLSRSWRVDEVGVDPVSNLNILTVTGVGPSAADTDRKPTKYVLAASTRVWKGRGFGTLADLKAGQNVLLNLTVCTLKGPGRVIDVWLDDEARALVSSQQLEIHRQYQREHGLAGWVDEVDNQKGIVGVVLFAGFDPKLLDAFPMGDTIAGAVAGDSLRTYDQINDNKKGPITAIDKVPVVPGSSGVRIKFQPSNLIEGYRPTKIVRLFSSQWKVDDLPREEKLY
jgi:hypothetical protein